MRVLLAMICALGLLAGAVGAQQDFLPTELQQALKDRGFDPGPIDGRPGKRTEAAIRAFQTAEGLDVTGQADLETAEALGLIRKGEVPEDLEAVMDIYLQMTSRFVILMFKQNMGLGLMTTEAHPLYVFFGPNQSDGSSVSLTLADRGEGKEDRDMTFSSLRMETKGLEMRPANLLTTLVPEMVEMLGEEACDETENTSGVGMPFDFVCVTSGGLEMGFVFKSEGNTVSCPKGILEISGNNKIYRISSDAECFVNLHPIHRVDGAWALVNRAE